MPVSRKYPAPSLVDWFAAPEFSTPDVTRHARVLWFMSWAFFGVVAVMLAIAVLVEPHTLARRATTIAAVGALVVSLHALSRTGRPVLASWLLAIGLSVIVTQRAWITGGIEAPVAVFYALFIVMAGVLIGFRGGLATAAVCFLGAIVLTVGTQLEWLVPRPGSGSPLGAFVFVALAIGMALVLQGVVNFGASRRALAAEAVQMFVHDMRSPMHILIGHLELLRDDIHGDAVRDVEAAMDGATTLQRMTNSLLDVSRLDAGRMPVQRAFTDLSVLATSVVSAMRILGPTRLISVEARGDVVCNCDPELTRRVIENLVSNAMKHTAANGRVRVVIGGSPTTARIDVHDEGPGVLAERRALIFERFSAQGLRSVSGRESSGLGLAFCKLAVEAQGGTIRVEAVLPHGSAFIVELPR